MSPNSSTEGDGKGKSGKYETLTSPSGAPRRAPPPAPMRVDVLEKEVKSLVDRINDLESTKTHMAKRIIDLNSQKAQAVAIEDYDLAKKCKLEVRNLQEFSLNFVRLMLLICNRNRCWKN